MDSHTNWAVGNLMKLPIKWGSMELINQPLTMEFSVLHCLNIGSVGVGWDKSPLIYPNLSLLEIYISMI